MYENFLLQGVVGLAFILCFLIIFLQANTVKKRHFPIFWSRDIVLNIAATMCDNSLGDENFVAQN